MLVFASNISLASISWATDIDVFAKVEGLQCHGLSTNPSFADAIVVRSLSGGISNTSIIAPPGGGGGGGRSTPAPLKIAKDFDGCSPLLFRAVAQGQHFSRVTISLVTTNNPSHVFFEIELSNALVEKMTLGANDALAQTSEEVSFIFQK